MSVSPPRTVSELHLSVCLWLAVGGPFPLDNFLDIRSPPPPPGTGAEAQNLMWALCSAPFHESPLKSTGCLVHATLFPMLELDPMFPGI